GGSFLLALEAAPAVTWRTDASKRIDDAVASLGCLTPFGAWRLSNTGSISNSPRPLRILPPCKPRSVHHGGNEGENQQQRRRVGAPPRRIEATLQTRSHRPRRQ